jgi:hypothetical protein
VRSHLPERIVDADSNRSSTLVKAMFKSIRRKIYHIIAILFLVMQSIVICPLLATAMPIAQVNSSPAANEQQKPTDTPDRTGQPQSERQNRTQQPSEKTADKETAKNTQPYDVNVIKQFDDELYGK